jgi:hypothetical protein
MNRNRNSEHAERGERKSEGSPKTLKNRILSTWSTNEKEKEEKFFFFFS